MGDPNHLLYSHGDRGFTIRHPLYSRSGRGLKIHHGFTKTPQGRNLR